MLHVMHYYNICCITTVVSYLFYPYDDLQLAMTYLITFLFPSFPESVHSTTLKHTRFKLTKTYKAQSSSASHEKNDHTIKR